MARSKSFESYKLNDGITTTLLRAKALLSGVLYYMVAFWTKTYQMPWFAKWQVLEAVVQLGL